MAERWITEDSIHVGQYRKRGLTFAIETQKNKARVMVYLSGGNSEDLPIFTRHFKNKFSAVERYWEFKRKHCSSNWDENSRRDGLHRAVTESEIQNIIRAKDNEQEAY